jgi:hypothetical protein
MVETKVVSITRGQNCQIVKGIEHKRASIDTLLQHVEALAPDPTNHQKPKSTKSSKTLGMSELNRRIMLDTKVSLLP